MMSTYSDQIREYRGGVYANPYQGTDKRVCFVCSMGLLRSATGARMYAHKYNTRNAGTCEDALIPLTPNLIEWADEIVFVNNENAIMAERKYHGTEHLVPLMKKMRVLAIPDHFAHMEPGLIKEFEEQYGPR